MTVQMFFPFAHVPRGKAMDLVVRKDATVEEVLGFALWSYWEESWLPCLAMGWRRMTGAQSLLLQDGQ